MKPLLSAVPHCSQQLDVALSCFYTSNGTVSTHPFCRVLDVVSSFGVQGGVFVVSFFRF